MFTQEKIDALKALLVEKGMPEENAADAILSMQSLMGESELEAPEMPSAEMPMGDVMPPEEKKPEGMGESYEALSKAFSAMQDVMKGLQSELATLKQSRAKDEQDAKEKIFAQFKREGRFSFVREDVAREIFTKDFELFKKTFSAISPLNSTAPKAPALKSVSEVTQTRANNLTAPLFSTEDVQSYAKTNNVDFKSAMLALSRAQKGK